MSSQLIKARNNLPSKYQSNLYDTIADPVAEMLAKGCSIRGTAGTFGIHEDTIRYWKETIPLFLELIEIKREARRISLLQKIENAADNYKTWQAGAWILERTYKGEYDPPQVSGKGKGSGVTINLAIQISPGHAQELPGPVVEAIQAIGQLEADE